MKLYKITKEGKTKGFFVDTESRVVYNPASTTAKFIGNNASKQYWNDAITFYSNRRGSKGARYISSSGYTNEVTPEETQAFEAFLKTLKKCKNCGIYEESMPESGLCTSCTANGYAVCPVCNDIVRSPHRVHGFAENTCMECVLQLHGTNELQTCEICETMFVAHEGGRCPDCVDEDRAYGHNVRGYHDNPQLDFKRGKGQCHNLYFGFELEMDGAGESSRNSMAVGKFVGTDVFFTRDGSLTNGFEMVSQPMHYEYFLERKTRYEKLFQKAVSLGYSSHKATTCGLHFHINREYFTEEEIVKMVYLFEKHWSRIVRFSRRTKGRLERWAGRYGEYHIADIENKKCDKNKDEAQTKLHRLRIESRYRAVNLRNEKTIEIRVFRGTLNINTFMASWQLLLKMTEAVKSHDIDQLRTMSWEELVKSDFAELNAYLKQRGIDKNTMKPTKKLLDM